MVSITQRVVTSSALQVAINLVQRVIGVVSTLVLARLLTPDDFGIIAILALTTHLIDILSDAGSQQYIIQKQDADRTDLDTAWSIDVASKFILTAIIWLLAPVIAETLDNDLLTNAIRIVSLSIPLRALRNPALILLAKELNYKPLFKLGLWQKMLAFVTVMAIVVIHPGYWAIVAGDIVAGGVMLIGSYRIHPYRPQWTLARIREQWQFSQWALLRGITGFGRSQADMLIVSRLFPAASLGGYHLQRELALMPAFSLMIPATEPLLAAIAKAKNDDELLRYRIRLSMVTLLAVLIPLSLFIFIKSELIVTVLLGEQWTAQHRLLSFFSLMFFAFCFHALISDCFAAINRMRSLFYFDLLSTLFIILLLLAFMNLEVHEFALLRGIGGLIITVSLLLLLDRLTGLNLIVLLLNLIPVLLATSLAVPIVGYSHSLMPANWWPFILLVFDTLIYFVVYLLALMVFLKILLQWPGGKISSRSEMAQFNNNILDLLALTLSKCSKKLGRQ